MQIYHNELTGKHYADYARAVLDMLEHGYELAADIDVANNQKAMFRRALPADGVFAATVEHAYISPVDVITDQS